MNWGDIEKLINLYRNRFDEDEPPANHLVSFETKLKQQSQAIYPTRKYLLRIAVVAGIMIASSSLIMMFYLTERDKSEKVTITKTNVELHETEKYYTEEIKKGIQNIKSQKNVDQSQKNAIISDLNSMDKNYQQLKKELKDNPGDERVIHAIIEHYQVKLDAIDQIISAISFSQNNLKPVKS